MYYVNRCILSVLNREQDRQKLYCVEMCHALLNAHDNESSLPLTLKTTHTNFHTTAESTMITNNKKAL